MNSTGGVPIEMVPYHKSELSSVNESLPVLRLLDVLIPPERGCGLPVFFSYAVIPVSSFLRVRWSVKSTVLRNLRKSQRAYVIVFFTESAYHEGSLTERLARLEMGIAIPREAGARVNGMAAVKKGRTARINACEKCISDWKRLKRLRRGTAGPLRTLQILLYMSEGHCVKWR